MTIHKTLFITGVSSGFGRALANEALAAGHRVIGTVRSETARTEFEQHPGGQAFARCLDVTDFGAIDAVVAEVENSLGPVDVLVNNAGYGHEGVFEESALEEMRQQFDVNVFGAVAVTKAFVPFFRQRRAGHIINITSMGGFITMPGIAYYCGSKFALEGISDTLSKELKPFGIAVTAVAPGSFRTDWAGRSMRRSERSIADYDASFDPIRAARQAKSGQQLGDPRKAARAMLSLIASDAPPAHLLLGSDALKLVRERLASMAQEIDAWEAVTRSTDV
ncbi:short-chain dehydrogenase/reductase [Pseudomonas prosekii]|uniref:Short-chain dehydrogenase/reductase n=1 Tax=Pseudomonas prosekii TaxID=1148509 RepID=A0A3L8CJ44_9PSED|nr:oxidoreductase [Pseudomonas prosekii]RLU07888.1 short-chain dehydrogenase/reductase [Pseudomonas prosekii]RLU10961.1 short-chain dehydrogenase/reductase [Pseudomonas prosekii]